MYRIEKATNDLIIEGFENGISPSPHKGLANLQNVNISTETGEAMCSYNRIQQLGAVANGTLTQVNTNTVSFSTPVKIGQWITILVDSGTGLSGSYYVESVGGVFKLSQYFKQDNSTIVSGINAGTATYSVSSMGLPLYSATEPYYDTTNTQQTRYYILDKNGRVWVHDTFTLTGIDTPLWFLPQLGAQYSGWNGLAVLNGWLVMFFNKNIAYKSTSTLGTNWYSGGGVGAPAFTITSRPHATLVGHQGKLYYTDGNFIGSLFPNTSLVTGGANIQSYCSYSAVTTTGTITANIGGSLPTLDDIAITRIPATFFVAINDALATALSSTVLYYIEYNVAAGTFQVFANATGGAAIDIQTGSSGTQYFNTFNPTVAAAFVTLTFTPQRLNLPFYETAQCMAELGNTVVIGCSGNVLYPWDQISPLPADLIPLPENDTHGMITVNNMLYVFAGHKGNVYLTNGSSASLVMTVPDYCAGIAGTPASYIEPYFYWGGAMYCRGRVYFSILDQTATKAGNCGGVWSFVPTQNFYIGQDTGLALRLENQNSYGTYNGYAPVLINSMVQTAIAPQYWAGWVSDINTPTYGIDFTDTVPCTTAIIETDLIPTGTVINKKTFQQLEYKLASPLANGESISLNYRLNGVDAWTSVGTLNIESTTALAGYFDVNFQNTQWTQLQVILNSLGNSSSSFCRLNEVRMR